VAQLIELPDEPILLLHEPDLPISLHTTPKTSGNVL